LQGIHESINIDNEPVNSGRFVVHDSAEQRNAEMPAKNLVPGIFYSLETMEIYNSEKTVLHNINGNNGLNSG
jgi:hypothetical protein